MISVCNTFIYKKNHLYQETTKCQRAPLAASPHFTKVPVVFDMLQSLNLSQHTVSKCTVIFFGFFLGILY